MAAGMLDFNGEKINLSYYKTFLAKWRPRGKDKTALVRLVNHKPFEVAGKFMQRVVSGGAVKGIQCICSVDEFPYIGKEGSEPEMRSGVLRYYTDKRPSLTNANAVVYTPEREYFNDGHMRILEKNDALLLFMIANGKSNYSSRRIEVIDGKETSVGWANTPPVWQITMPGDKSAAKGKALNKKADAMQRVLLALKADLGLARQLYEALGYTDWDLYVDNKGNGDFTEIKMVLLEAADTNPDKVIKLLNDTALDLSAKVTMALTLQLMETEGDVWFWGRKASPDDKGVGKYTDMPVKDKTIVKVPRGKAGTQEAAFSWFIDYLKGEPDVVAEMNYELDLYKSKEEA